MLKIGILILVGMAGFWLLSVQDFSREKTKAGETEGYTESLSAPREVIDPLADLSGAIQPAETAKERMTFSNTMTLGPAFAAVLDAPAPLIGSAEAEIHIPAFPANTSERTKKELELLHTYVALRTPERLLAIQAEVEMSGVRIGPDTLATYLSDPRYTVTGKLLDQLFDEIEPIVMRQKVKFDRVRPHKLDPTLVPVIAVPEHAAYPSGHSTQAYAVAFLLSAIASEQQAEFEQDALRVAVNREIAGVHYPSDSAAGRLLARQIVDQLLEHQSFVTMIDEAKGEWTK